MVEASNKEAAVAILKSQGLYVSNIEELFVPLYAKKITLFDRVSAKEIVLFSRQLSVLLKSRVPLVESLGTIANQTRNPAFKEKLQKIMEKVQGGTSLSVALAMYPKIFSTFYISMLKSGEASGKLIDVFIYLADYMQKDSKFKSKIKGAMIYPAFVSIVFLAVTSLIVIYVIPQLTEVLKDSGQQLPLITRIVMGLSDFMKAWWWVILLILAPGGFIVFRFGKTPSGKKFFNKAILQIPMLGGFAKKIYISRFALNFSTLISGGLPIISALDITGNVIGNDVYKNIIDTAKEEIRKGKPMSSVLERYPKYIFPIFYQMVLVGEKTGTLDSSLKNVVEFYEDDVDRALEEFIKLLEPLLIIALGGTVGLLLGAVLIPIYSMSME